MSLKVLFLGGNGHCTARLDPARRAIAAEGLGIELLESPYPGFEGRSRATDLDGFLDRLSAHAAEVGPDRVYATGIGGLLLLALRARGELVEQPAILQGAVLWGLEERLFARVMRGPMPYLLQWALRTPLARARFRKKHLPAGVDASTAEAFFQGYAQCRAFPDFFRWLRAPLLRRLERDFAQDPAGLSGLSAWWGEQDHVVGWREFDLTEAALDVQLPRRSFASWGHYPMLEDPAGWSRALADDLA